MLVIHHSANPFRWRQFRRVILECPLRMAMFLTGMFCVAPMSLNAQTLFQWPTKNVDVSRYKTIEECASATERVKDSAQRSDQNWADTMPIQNGDARRLFPVPVIQTATLCVERFESNTLQIDMWHFMFRLMLYANREAAADSILSHRLSFIKGADSVAAWTRASVLDSAIHTYLTVLPVRFSVIERRLRERLAIHPSSAVSLTGVLNGIFHSARNSGMPDLTTFVARQFDSIAPRASDECGGDNMCLGMTRDWHSMALNYLKYDVSLDSLRSNTAAYAKIRQENWEKAIEKIGGEALPIGRHAPAIQGDFWFDRRQPSDSMPVALQTSLERPTKGAVSLIVFLKHVCRTDTQSLTTGCLMEYAVLRRLAARFPELSITIVSRTAGHYWLLEPPAPADEAVVLARWWQGYHRLPAALAVTKTSFWRLEEPDRRRINEITPSEVAYSLEGTFDPLMNRTALLLDRDGVIVEAGEILNTLYERELGELVDILMKRQ